MRYTKPLSYCLALALLFVCCQKEPTKTSSGTQSDSTTTITAPPPKLHMSLSYLLKQSTITGRLEKYSLVRLRTGNGLSHRQW
jgi:hypothetical protein